VQREVSSSPLKRSAYQRTLQTTTTLTWFLRKHKCGGFTSATKCRPCTTRKVKCSFEDEVNDARYNPYLRLRRRSPSGPPSSSLPVGVGMDSVPAALVEIDGGDDAQASSSSSAVPPAVAPNLSVVDGELQKQVELLKARLVLRFLLILGLLPLLLLTLWLESPSSREDLLLLKQTTTPAS
jgi:hypothetical protein